MAEWKISLRLIIRIDVVTDYAEQGIFIQLSTPKSQIARHCEEERRSNLFVIPIMRLLLPPKGWDRNDVVFC